MLSRTVKRLHSTTAAQAMVEFVILLFLLMILCAGMLYSSRLLAFKFWAQQEARFLAFEKTWVPKRAATADPLDTVTEQSYFPRAKYIRRGEAERSLEQEGGVSTLLAFFTPGEKKRKIAESDGESKVLLARKEPSLWQRKTKDLHWQKNGVQIIETAYASQMPYRKGDQQGVQLADERPLPAPQPKLKSKRKAAFGRVLKKGSFGGRFCREASNLAGGALKKHRGFANSFILQHGVCEQDLIMGLAAHLAQSFDDRAFFADFRFELERGSSAEEAFSESLQQAVAEGFYSFFDDRVKLANQGAPLGLDGAATAAGFLNTDEEVQRLLMGLRYIGSQEAVGALLSGLAALGTQSSDNRNADSEQAQENWVWFELGLLNDADEDIVLGASKFTLVPNYGLFIPIAKGAFAGAFEGIMKNVLSEEEDLVPTLIDKSLVETKVDYAAEGGLFDAIRRRFRHTDKVLTSRYALLTEEWQIERRKNSTAEYRQKGDEDDTISADTDEGMLKRRIAGLYILPTYIGAFFGPIESIDSDLAAVTDVLDSSSFVIRPLKEMVFKLGEILSFLNDIPGGEDLSFGPPQWPAVRVDAYPGSSELQGDKLSGEERNLDDYIEEQKKFKERSPDPVYN